MVNLQRIQGVFKVHLLPTAWRSEAGKVIFSQGGGGGGARLLPELIPRGVTGLGVSGVGGRGGHHSRPNMVTSAVGTHPIGMHSCI